MPEYGNTSDSSKVKLICQTKLNGNKLNSFISLQITVEGDIVPGEDDEGEGKILLCRSQLKLTMCGRKMMKNKILLLFLSNQANEQSIRIFYITG